MNITRACKACGKGFRPWVATSEFCSARCSQPTIAKRRTLEERFWEKVDKNGPVPAHVPELGPCWVWTSSTNGRGYGQISSGGNGGRPLKAHRVAWEMENGPIPDGLDVLHKCDNPICTRASHLMLGTHLDNMRDMFTKGRRQAAVGERAAGAKLCECAVRAIRRLSGEGVTRADLGRRFGVHPMSILAIVRREHWRHVA